MLRCGFLPLSASSLPRYSPSRKAPSPSIFWVVLPLSIFVGRAALTLSITVAASKVSATRDTHKNSPFVVRVTVRPLRATHQGKRLELARRAKDLILLVRGDLHLELLISYVQPVLPMQRIRH
jgi:hypothetical protein